MKKMVCEMCESTNFVRTAKGYTCKDCGMEYSAEVAKTLLKEINEESPTVVKSEISDVSSVNKSMNDEDLLKLKSELLVWYTFHEKCNQLEKGFFDDKEKLNGSTLPLLDRNIEFDVTKIKNKAHGQITTRCVNDFSKMENLSKEYDEYVKQYRTAKAADEEKNKCFNKLSLFWGLLWGGIGLTILVIFSFIGIPLIIYSLVQRKKYNKMFDDACIRLEQIDKKIYDEKNPTKELSFYDWMFANYFSNNQSNEYTKQIYNYYNKYDTNLTEAVDNYKKAVEELRSVRKEITEKVSLPEKYRSYEAVCGLLTLVIDGRATNLKDAINLYEEEKFRSTMIQSINSLSAKIDGLNNTMIKGLSMVVDTNLRMCQQLNDIKVLNEVLVMDAIWDI